MGYMQDLSPNQEVADVGVNSRLETQQIRKDTWI